MKRSFLLLLGHLVGLYVAAVALTILLAFMISGAWLLIVGLYRDQVNQDTSKTKKQ